MIEHNTAKRKDWPMSYVRACMAFGNGDVGRGRQALFMLAKRLEEATEKHPVFAEGPFQALGVIGAEFRELEVAVEHESPDRQFDEALDVATTAMRFVNGEHKLPEEKKNA